MNFTRITTIAACAFFVTVAAPAQAEVLTFDDVNTNSYVFPVASYQGFTMTNVGIVKGSSQGAGYSAGVVSSPNVMFNGNASLASISSASAFTLNSAYFTAAWSDRAVTVAGFNGSTQVFSETFNVVSSGPTLRNFSFAPITSFTWVSPNNSDGLGHIAIDNFTFNAASAVPEPTTWAMMLIGFGFIGWSLRRVKQVATVNFA
ncbi:PEPxxWA-CTERM sorting domain-containing protein [Sphingomonas floccifaciens]|jgi:hypothetical protein|uniref:PEPxxWA-CTERM sorting domain-containing protein n=1 Tax=Sphingomonas floccifaciens TaxID=1844115 RepID=A0ABW4N9F2_9SPHN